MKKREIISILREKRRSDGISIQDAAKALGVHRNTLGRIERDSTDIVDYSFLERYARYLDYDLTLIHKVKIENKLV